MRTLDPKNGSKMMGLLLIQDNSDKELICLAFSPEHLLHALVATARVELAGKPASPPSPLGYDGGADAFYADDYDLWSPAGGAGAGAHHRSFSLSNTEAAASWRPCMYYMRGYCKNDSSCRFLHGVPEDDTAEWEMAVMRAKDLAAVPPPQLMASAYPFSPSPKGGVSLSFLLQQHQQQSETQRCHFYRSSWLVTRITAASSSGLLSASAATVASATPEAGRGRSAATRVRWRDRSCRGARDAAGGAAGEERLSDADTTASSTATPKSSLSRLWATPQQPPSLTCSTTSTSSLHRDVTASCAGYTHAWEGREGS
ncbi:zinc finger CCCH domain-containing protein 53-like [Miscanthus floridulus]|uniref:zinc finger CCCH domain-containing protein 53-like n=1 Tax=Miscanthus floridulus TaxID=154761 RepID=UPI003458F946